LRVLDLFSGIGGFSLGLESAGPFRTIAFCEQEPFCQAVLRKHWDNVPIFDDVRTLPTDGLGRVDIIVGGWPCQPWSQAGQQRGAEDDRDLWPEVARLVGELRPRWLVGENVRGFVNQPMGLQRSLSDLESLGYETVPFIIPACAVDAPHRRDRVWIVAAKNDADADCKRSHRKNVNKHRENEPVDGQERVVGQVRPVLARSGDATERRSASVAHANGESEPDGTVDEGTQSGELVADADSERGNWGAAECGPCRREFVTGNGEAVGDTNRSDCSGFNVSRFKGKTRLAAGSRWPTEPDVGRVAHGVPERVDRLHSLGNAVVPRIPELIGRRILAASGVADAAREINAQLGGGR